MRFKKHSLQLRILVLEGKIDMSRIRLPQIGNLPADSNKGKFSLKNAANGPGKVSNCENFWCLQIKH
ncbi:MAG: hypothetical protein AMK70_15405 [Nitrospira bacterium SG8_35_1]|nr:MAG: hypothetical protein AMK70_15405 [Nitrospira bacterium SG8_35_1]